MTKANLITATFCLLAASLTVHAQTVTVSASVDVPAAKAPEIQALLRAWVSRQQEIITDPQTGELSGRARYRNLQHFLDRTFADSLRQTVLRACREIPASCPDFLVQRRTAKESADSQFESELDDTLRAP